MSSNDLLFIPKPMEYKVRLYPTNVALDPMIIKRACCKHLLDGFLAKKLGLQTNFSSITESTLQIAPAHNSAGEKTHVLQARSGTEAIVAAIKAAGMKEKISVAIPDFFCNHVMSLLQLNDIKYKFYSLDENLCFDENSYNKCMELGCNFLLIPHLFVYKNFNDIIKKIADKKTHCLIDVCQTYDAMFDKNEIIIHDYVHYVLSFGHSKPSQSIGGGALISTGKEFWQNLKNVIANDYFFDFTFENKFFESYADFLNYQRQQSMENKFQRKYESIPAENALVAYTNLSNAAAEENYRKNFNALKKCICRVFGTSSLRYAESANESIPSIFAIHVDGDRYVVGKELSKLGIETTWYYPRNYDAPVNEISENIWRHILILPFSRYHSENDISELIFALEKYKNENC